MAIVLDILSLGLLNSLSASTGSNGRNTLQIAKFLNDILLFVFKEE